MAIRLKARQQPSLRRPITHAVSSAVEPPSKEPLKGGQYHIASFPGPTFWRARSTSPVFSALNRDFRYVYMDTVNQCVVAILLT
jgi:hypothetical protein